MTFPRKEIWVRTWDFLKHPITALIISLILFMIPYLPSRGDQEPYYGVSQEISARGTPYLLSEQYLSEQLRREFQGPRVSFNRTLTGNQSERSFIHVAIWNAGSDPIHRNETTTINPIRVKPSAKVDISDLMIVRTSRSDLAFETHIASDENGFESVVVNIKGDEALEKFDGGSFLIAYKSNSQEAIQWSIIGRVIGNPAGFRSMEWLNITQKYERSIVTRILPFSASVTLFSFLLLIYSKWKEKTLTKRYVLIFLPFFITFSIAMYFTLIEEYEYAAIPYWVYEATQIAW